MGLFDLFKKNTGNETPEKKERLNQGLEKTKTSIFSKISKALTGKSKVDAGFLDELEEILITSDVGVQTTIKIIERLENRVASEKYSGAEELMGVLKQEITQLLTETSTSKKLTNKNEKAQPMEVPPATPGRETNRLKQTFSEENQKDLFEKDNHKPYIILVTGVNGVGKTTTIGKLAWEFKNAGKKVILGAADTFRAAAVDQLKIWGERVGVEVIEKGMQADPASVAFDATKTAVEQNADVLIIDTAGRLHNKVNLMNELSKIKRVIGKVVENGPHEMLLVLDASTGQNAFEQAKQFTAATEINALALTKLDGTAKGGVVIGIADQFKIPIKYIGVGEKMEDLQIFDEELFVNALFEGTTITA